MESARFAVRGFRPSELPIDVPDVCPGCGGRFKYHIEFDRGW